MADSPVPSAFPDFATLTDVIAPWAMRVAATFRLADHIADGITGRDTLAAEVGADPDSLGRLMRFLIARGVFSETAPGEYGLSATAQLLRTDHPAQRWPWLDLAGAGGRLDSTYAGMFDAIRTGDPVYETVHGLPFWEDLAADPVLSESFDAMMAGHASWFGEVAAAYDWSGVRKVADVGGGTGALLAAVLATDERLSGLLVDLPATVAGAGEILAPAGLSARCEVVGSSFFDAWPTGADVYLLSHVLHDWNDEKALEILRRAAQALPENGRLLLIERIIGDGEGPGGGELLATKMDLRMLVLVGGRERTVEDFGVLAAKAGLSLRPVGVTPSGVSLLECRPA